jgi:hypothetical protein
LISFRLIGWGDRARRDRNTALLPDRLHSLRACHQMCLI